MKNKLANALILLLLCISACQKPAVPESSPTEKPSQSQTVSTLTICLGYEPESLYYYAASSQAARDVLQAIYDGPFDTVDGQAVPVILEAIPNFKDGSVSITPVSAQAGDEVMDIYGEVIELQSGSRVFPSGCTSTSCAISWDGITDLQMDQPSAIFHLLPGLRWSDGQSLTASDSVYSFELAADQATPGSKIRVNQTISYNALDKTTILWVGMPGVVTDSYQDYFWMPLPRHAWAEISAANLPDFEQAARNPLGWGPYVLDEWKSGEYIRLTKNPYYFRADEGLPKFDTLIFKITDSYGDTNIANLKFDREPYAQFKYDLGEFEAEVNQSGCDLTSTTADMTDQLDVLNILMNYFSDPAVQVMQGAGKQTGWLLFNQSESGLFSNLKMREAVAACLERGEIADTVFHNLVQIPGVISFNADKQAGISNPALTPDAPKGRDLLEQSGWQAGNPRSALNIEGLSDGSPLSINYLVENDNLNLAIANQVKTSLGECGIQVNIIAASPEVFWNPDSSESVFQGAYHLAQLNWALPIENPCPLFTSAAIPQAGNNYNGLNFGGFSNAQVEEICSQLVSTPLAAKRQDLLAKVESILNQDLPLIPLYTYSDLMVARIDFCPIQTGSQSELAGIESFDYGESCVP